MAIVVLVVHEDRPEAVAQADVLAAALVTDGHRVDRSDDPDFVSSGVDDATELVVSLGGDGSILRAVNLLDGRTAPVLGVNHGELGYLTTVEPVDAHASVSRVLAGQYDLEERMMLRVEMFRANEDVPEVVGYALNEVVVERGAGGQTVRVAVSLDGEPFTSYAADGLIAGVSQSDPHVISGEVFCSLWSDLLQPRHLGDRYAPYFALP